MTVDSFVKQIENHPELQFLVPPKDGVYKVINSNMDMFEIYDRDIDGSWDQWEIVLLGKRQPKIMEQFTRIVGYYSDLKNWNASKTSELKDRHKGNYEIH